MSKKFLGYLFLVSILACKSSKESADAGTNVSAAVANGKTVVIAQVLEILDDKLASYPCSELPCYAIVKIEEVLKSSANFQYPYAAGQEGKMRFVFSLSETTEKHYPNLDRRFPGLKVGDRFRASVSQEQLMESNSPQWGAYEYILLH